MFVLLLHPDLVYVLSSLAKRAYIHGPMPTRHSALFPFYCLWVTRNPSFTIRPTSASPRVTMQAKVLLVLALCLAPAIVEGCAHSFTHGRGLRAVSPYPVLVLALASTWSSARERCEQSCSQAGFHHSASQSALCRLHRPGSGASATLDRGGCSATWLMAGS